MFLPLTRRVDDAEGRPRVGRRIVTRSRIQLIRKIMAAPHNHPASRPHRRVVRSSLGCVYCADWLPAVSGRIVATAVVEICVPDESSPYDHFTAGPHCTV